MSDQYDQPTNNDAPYPEPMNSGPSQYQEPTNYPPKNEQSQYGAYPYQQPQNYAAPQGYGSYGKSPEQEQGEKFAQTSMILGIISIFFAGIILGPLAIHKASQAQQLNADATVGKITGWIGTILAALSLLWVLFMIVIIAAAGSSGY